MTTVESSVDLEDAPDAVGELPPSCRLVWLYLTYQGPETQQAIAEGTATNQRTVRWALHRLEDVGVIERRPCPGDARQTLYSVEKPDSSPGL